MAMRGCRGVRGEVGDRDTHASNKHANRKQRTNPMSPVNVLVSIPFSCEEGVLGTTKNH